MTIRQYLTEEGSFLLQWQIFGFALLLLGGFVAYDLYRDHVIIDTAERVQLSTQARVVEQNMERQLGSISRTLAGVRGELPRWDSLPDGREQAIHRLKALSEAMTGVRTLLVLNAQGIVTVSNREQIIGQDFSYRDYFQAPLHAPDPDTLYVSPPFRTLLGVFAMNVSRAVVGPDGRFAGIVTATLNPEEFDVLLNSVLYAPDMLSALAHGDGRLFMMRPEREGTEGLDLAGPGTLFSRHEASGKLAGVLVGRAPVSGEERMVALHTIQPPALHMDKPMVIAVTREMESIFASWQHDAYLHVGLYVSLVLASVLGLFVYKHRQREYDQLVARQADEQRKAAERLKLATGAAGMGVWEYDLASGSVIWDDSMFAIYGMEPAKFTSVYEAWRNCLLPEDVEKAEAAFKPALEQGLPYDTSFRIRRGDGQVRIIRAVARVLHDASGRALRMVGTNEDITERKEREQQRLADEVSYRNTLVREVHHRIKNNLQGVAGLLRLELGKYLEMNPRLEKAIGQVHTIAAVHGLQCIDPEEAILLSDTVSEICHALQAQFQRPIIFRVENDRALTVQLDKEEAVAIALVLNELILNALKHTPQGGIDPEVTLQSDGMHARLVIRNGLAGEPGFDFNDGRGLNTGLSLVRSLLPKQGTELSYEKDGEFLLTRLVLTEPVVEMPREGGVGEAKQAGAVIPRRNPESPTRPAPSSPG